MEQTEFEHIAPGIRRKVLATALAFPVDPDTAEDIAQEVMLKLWTLRTAIADQAHALKLAYCMARHQAIDSHRRKSASSLAEGKDLIDDSALSPDRVLEDKETLAWLTQRLASLPSTEYQILWLRQVERKSHEEIAQAVGVSKSSVPTLLARARAKLLNEFKNRKP